jgi:3'-5' exoribonuclease
MSTTVKELRPGEDIAEFFICARKSVRSAKNGSTYLALKLTDASGGIEARMWDVDQGVIESFDQGDVVRVEGSVTSDDYGTQLKVTGIRRAGSDDDYSLENLMPSSPRPLGEMEEELAVIREGIADTHLTALLDEIFATDINYRSFCEAPAAKGVHHNYIHGLLEHTIGVCRICDSLAGLYPEVNRDLLLAGAILHDIGKTVEFKYTTAIDYSDPGRLLGHIVLGERIIAKAVGNLDSFPRELELQLLHLVLAHHGELEFGSPQVPQTLEAFFLHYADNIDARANVFAKKRVDTDEDWSDFDRVLSRFLYLKRAEED